jgi:hypothetical protein
MEAISTEHGTGTAPKCGPSVEQSMTVVSETAKQQLRSEAVKARANSAGKVNAPNFVESVQDGPPPSWSVT